MGWWDGRKPKDSFPERERPHKKRGGKKKRWVLERRCTKLPDRDHWFITSSKLFADIFRKDWHAFEKYATQRDVRNAIKGDVHKRRRSFGAEFQYRIVSPEGEIENV